MDLSAVLEDCLQRLAAGEGSADCLARYPECRAELAPMLAAAEQLHALSQARLTQGQRLRAKVVLREELAAAGAARRSKPPGLLGWARARAVSLAAVVAVLLFVGVGFSAVASSRPGDLAYPVRVVMERAPAWLKFDAAGRTAAELAVADRRLSDILRDGLGDAVAVNALLRSDMAAALRAQVLSDAAKAEAARRVAAHADELGALASLAKDPATEARLRAAAEQVAGLAAQITPLVTLPEKPPAPTVTVTRESAAQPPAVILPATPAPVTAQPSAAPVVEPTRPRRIETVVASTTPGPRVWVSVTPPALPWTPGGPRSGEGTPVEPAMTPRLRLSLTVTPRSPRLTPIVTVPAWTVEVPTPPTIVITVPPIVITVPSTFVIPSPVISTGTPGQASINTATPRAWPTPSYLPTTTVWWVTFTPAPLGTPRPDIRAILTAMVTASPDQTQTVVPGARTSATPRRPRATDASPSTPTAVVVEQPTSIAEFQPILTPDVTPTAPPRPR